MKSQLALIQQATYALTIMMWFFCVNVFAIFFFQEAVKVQKKMCVWLERSHAETTTGRLDKCKSHLGGEIALTNYPLFALFHFM